MAEPQRPRRANPRLAAGRARVLGAPTRGTTTPNRLQRMDNWIVATLHSTLRNAPDPLVVDLGGFEFAGLRPALARAANVLRQNDEAPAAAAWRTMGDGLADHGILVEGTCDETGRRRAWVLLDGAGPRALTLACRLDGLSRPSELAERLPKALIHRNVPGEPIRAFLHDLDAAWQAAAPLSPVGSRQRWIAACTALRASWPVRTDRSRYGELTVAWSAVGDA